MSTGFVICSRLRSSRVPNKAFTMYEGKPQIEHLVDRLLQTDIPVFIAVPDAEVQHYAYLMHKYPKRVSICGGFPDDPLRRMYGVAKDNGLKKIIRVTHDKIFVDPCDVFAMLGQFNRRNLDYAYSSTFIPGTGFEIISFDALEKAAQQFKKVEHISYAIKAITTNSENIAAGATLNDPMPRLLVDYPEDVQLMNLIFAALGPNCTQNEVMQFLEANAWAARINRQPKVTVYTCAYNARNWITQCMGSVAAQGNFSDIEYLLIDDHSSDDTALQMAKFASLYDNVQWERLTRNVGLASASNIALKKARGKYMIRIDADDYFSGRESIATLVEEAERHGLDAVYPHNYLGVARKQTQDGKENHHVGGTLFRTAALNHIRFTDGMRNYEGLDLYSRAREQLKIGYLAKPTFVYRQHPNSMSKTNLEERALTKKKIEERSGAKTPST